MENKNDQNEKIYDSVNTAIMVDGGFYRKRAYTRKTKIFATNV